MEDFNEINHGYYIVDKSIDGINLMIRQSLRN